MNSNKLSAYKSTIDSLTLLDGPRYVALGFNKTGTTTLSRCFEILGLNPVADTKSSIVQFKYLMDQFCLNHDYQLCLEVASRFRSLHNRPWNIGDMFKHIDKRFPGSRFILTQRDPDVWWRSVEQWLTVKHAGDNERLQRYFMHFGINQFNKQLFIKNYEEHNYRIEEYFRGRKNLLIINFDEGHGWAEICQFLNLPIPEVSFPHINQQNY